MPSLTSISWMCDHTRSTDRVVCACPSSTRFRLASAAERTIAQKPHGGDLRHHRNDERRVARTASMKAPAWSSNIDNPSPKFAELGRG